MELSNPLEIPGRIVAPSEQLVLAASNLAGVHLFYELSFLLVNTAFREVSCASIAGSGRSDGPDVFVHYTAVLVVGHRTLKEGDVVEFEVVQGAKGLQAANVVVRFMRSSPCA